MFWVYRAPISSLSSASQSAAACIFTAAVHMFDKQVEELYDSAVVGRFLHNQFSPSPPDTLLLKHVWFI